MTPEEFKAFMAQKRQEASRQETILGKERDEKKSNLLASDGADDAASPEPNVVDQVALFVQRFVFLKDPKLYRLLAVWVIATYLHKDFDYIWTSVFNRLIWNRSRRSLLVWGNGTSILDITTMTNDLNHERSISARTRGA